MASTAEPFGYVGNIYLAFAAKANPIACVGKLPEKRCDLDILNGQGVVHQPFTVLFFGPALFHLLLRYRDPGERPVAMEV